MLFIQHQNMSELQNDVIKIENIVNLLIEKKKVRYNFKTTHDSILHYIHTIVHRILSEFDLTFLTETIHVIFIELITNFLKAIVKRIYFLQKQLDISNYTDYVENISAFKSEILEHWDEKEFKLEDFGYTLFFDFILTDDYFTFYIKNNVKVNIFERERIQNRLNKIFVNNSSYEDDIDSTEGGGLGLILILSLLENSGISKKNFKFDFLPDATVAILNIPLKLNKPKIEVFLRNLILKRIDVLPTFPEYVQDLIEKCDQGEVTTDYIANKIIKDPALTSQILKLATSAGYITRNKNPDIKLSINLIGLKQLKHLLMIYAAKNVFNKIVERSYFEKLWYESNRIAFFAQKLTQKEELKEMTFLIGILNLVGKFVIYSLDANEIQKIRELSNNKVNLGDQVLEELEIGISYPEVGSILAELWKFPEDVIYGIRYQFKPLHISDDKIDLVYPIYLAKFMSEILSNRFSFDLIEFKVLKYYGFYNNKDKFFKVLNSLFDDFQGIFVV